MDQKETVKTKELELEICSVVAKCTNIILVITDCEGRFFWANDAFEQTFQYENTEIEGKKLYEFILGKDSDPKTTLNISTAIQNQQPFKEEIIQYKKNKTPIWILTDGHPVFDDHNQLLKYVIIQTDITDRKKAESKLIENEQRYKLVTKATFDAIWDWDLESNKLYRGEGFSTLFGYDLDRLKDDPSNWEEQIHPEDLGKVHQNFKNYFESNLTNWTEEYRFLKADGTYTYVRDKAIFIRNSEQKVVRIVGALQDIGEQKLREQQLTLLESVITNTSDAVVITDALSATSSGSRIIYINDAFTKMTGYHLEDVLGKTPRLLQGPMTNRNELERLRIAIENWEPCEIETVNYKKNGDPFWVNLSVVPVANEKAEYTHWIAIQKDVTERRKQMEEREQMIHELTKNNHELKQFSYITSHNVRAPLTNMLGILNLIDSSESTDHRMKRLVDGLKESTLNLNDTLNDLIKILIIKENSHIELEKIYFENILNKVIESIQNTIEISGTVINSNFEAAEYVFFSKVYLESIFLNLITNAIKFKIPGIDPQINIYSTNTIDGIQLHISDNGLGMDWQKVKNKIFGLYQKFHDNKDSKGIGLYLVHAQVTALGGTVELNTALNKGSNFIITFKKAKT